MERVVLIERVVHKLELNDSFVVEGYRPPSIEDDMADSGVAVFGGNPPVEVSCEL
jgi:hypothetical protein